MLTRSEQPSAKLCTFLNPLIESLSKPQQRHLRELGDALLVCETEPPLAALQRLFVQTTDASNWADFLRLSPWSGDAVRAGGCMYCVHGTAIENKELTRRG